MRNRCATYFDSFLPFILCSRHDASESHRLAEQPEEVAHHSNPEQARVDSHCFCVSRRHRRLSQRLQRKGLQGHRGRCLRIGQCLRAHVSRHRECDQERSQSGPRHELQIRRRLSRGELLFFDHDSTIQFLYK